MTLSTIGTMVVFAAVSLAAVPVAVSGSANELQVSSVASLSNVQTERSPLHLLFSAGHPVKWDAANERQMLRRAAEAVSKAGTEQNVANTVHSLLREELPQDKKDAIDLASLGIKLG